MDKSNEYRDNIRLGQPDEAPKNGSWKRITTGSNYTPPKKKRKKRH